MCDGPVLVPCAKVFPPGINDYREGKLHRRCSTKNESMLRVSVEEANLGLHKRSLISEFVLDNLNFEWLNELRYKVFEFLMHFMGQNAEWEAGNKVSIRFRR